MNLRAFARAVAVAAVVLGSASSAAAQGGGIKFGPTFTEFSSDALEWKNRTGIHAGLFFGGNRDGLLGLQSELNWIRKSSESDRGAIRIDYLQVPVLLRLNIGSRSSSGPIVYGLGGPAVDIKIADEIDGVTIDNGFEGVDVTMIVGGGFEVARIVVEGRWDKGFRRINNLFSDVIEIKKQTFSVLIGIRLQ
jgi:outer membrane protein with beta-barrel domain